MELSDRAHFEETLSNARQALLNARTPGRHWEGELSSSALSTATAVFALSLYRARRPDSGHDALIARGFDWLASHQNADGGWGDTVKSFSNISTTALCWAAFAAHESKTDYSSTVSRAEACLKRMSSDSRCPPLAESAADQTHVVPPLRPGEGWGEGKPPKTSPGQVQAPEIPPHPDPPPMGEGVGKVAGNINVALSSNRAEGTRSSSLDPAHLIPAIIKRYGKDHTFSVPILTMCALAGRLGTGRDAWRRIPQLPFELAAFPQRWFKWLKLPVVSYALPALIAIGLVRHYNRPTRNPIGLFARRLARGRALRLLERIQPTTGGYLEATPLTSFVVMSLVGAGLADSPVVSHGIEFLVRSARPDGSWAIDTNLATWVTTLAVNALIGEGEAPKEPGAENPENGRLGGSLALPGAEKIRDWLLDQQYRTEHPYTLADPGGWAWTDLPGGVPDADDTPGALLALHRLGAPDERTVRAAEMGVRWLMNLQNRDMGIPTFCKGWGKLPFDRSSFDLTAHAMRAWHAWAGHLSAQLQDRVAGAMNKAMSYLVKNQRPDGAWAPLWFGNQYGPQDENPTYGTAKVLCAAECFGTHPPHVWIEAITLGANWLLHIQNPDGGWGGDVATPSTIEETALALEGLATVAGWNASLGKGSGADIPVCLESASVGAYPLLPSGLESLRGKGMSPLGDPKQTGMSAPPGSDQNAVEHSQCAEAIRRGTAWLIEHTDRGQSFDPSPIGFYFAKLWYFEKLYPVIFTVAALNAVKRYDARQKLVMNRLSSSKSEVTSPTDGERTTR